MKYTTSASLFLGFAALVYGTAASAQVHLNIGIPAPVYVAPAPVYAPPPPPVYVAPPPVYAPPPPVAYAPPPAYYGPSIVVGWHGDRYWDGRRYWGRDDWYRHHGGPYYGHRDWR